MKPRAEGALVCLTLIALFGCGDAQKGEAEGMRFLEEYDAKAGVIFNENVKASWAYYTNITKESEANMIAYNLKSSEFDKEAANNASEYDWKNFQNATARRLFEKISNIGFAAVDDTSKLEKISQLEADLTGMYSTGEVCLSASECLQLEPGLTDVLTTSRDYDRLLAVWKGFRDATGKKMRQKYTEFANVMNEAIRFSGFDDTGDYWRSWYETPTFEQDVKTLYDQFRPMYQQLHAYVRRQLKKTYGADKFPSSGHIPAHLFGNMWSQQWNNIIDLVNPYPNASGVDITARMKELGYNITHMYRVAEEFFVSIGMDPMPDMFWTKSMLEKPEDREVVCHASAWDFYDGEDFRIKQCTSVTEDQLLTVHHEMGHVVYYQNYNHLPRLFRRGANPGFHEGMADIVSLSFQTPEHMKAIDLIQTIPNDTESDINFLMRMALDKVAFLPFGYLIDQWRWSVFRGDTTEKTYNQDWWKLRCGFQGISPPVQRTEEDFDPGAKYHIPGNTPYIRYFVSYVVQFQWHKALCEVAGHTGPLHRCDIYRNTDAGDKLREMLKMGSSEKWPKAMEAITGNPEMSALPLVEYFKPLTDWLKEQNEKEGETVGWNDNECPNGGITTINPLSGSPQPTLSVSVVLILTGLSVVLNYLNVISK